MNIKASGKTHMFTSDWLSISANSYAYKLSYFAKPWSIHSLQKLVCRFI